MLLLLATCVLLLSLLVVNVQASGPFSQALAEEQLMPTPQATTLPQELSLQDAGIENSGIQASSVISAGLPTTVPEVPPTAEALKASQSKEPAAVPQTDLSGQPSPFAQGTLFLAMDEAGSTHLFAYQPQLLPVTRLTAGDWDDITPSANPDGSRLAFASNRDGAWDLYLLDLASGEIIRITDTPEYDSHPSWSPDGRWLAYESYTGQPDGSGGGLDLFLVDIGDGAAVQPPYQPDRKTPTDHSPAWSPDGRNRVCFRIAVARMRDLAGRSGPCG
jgi:hypothetical protein